MSGYLADLLAQARGEPPAVQRRPRFRFEGEPGGTTGEELLLDDQVTLHTEPVAVPLQTAIREPSRQPQSAGTRHDSPPAAMILSETDRERGEIHSRPGLPIEQFDHVGQRQGEPGGEYSVERHGRVIQRVAPPHPARDRLPEPGPAITDAKRPEPAEPPIAGIPDEPSLPQRPGLGSGLAPAPAPTPISPRQHSWVPQTQTTRVAPAVPGTHFVSDVPDREPEITISIGRLDIRLTPAAEPILRPEATVPPPAPPGAAVSLDDYLRRRTRGES
jgi:hypothetical protein